ncbi:MAG: hypothetical protein AB7S50_11375 [Bacteroidales bacterium]
MKNLKKLMAIMLMLVSVFFFACNDDDEKDPLSPENAKTTLTDLGTQMSADMEQMMNSDGMNTIQILNSLSDPFAPVTVKSGIRTSVLPNIEKYLIPTLKKDLQKSATAISGFEFNEWTGTYTWDNELGLWNPSDNPTDRIILIFPSDSTDMDNNDAQLTIYNYQEEMFVDDEMYEYYQPTAISADLKVDNVLIVEISLTASWTAEGEPETLNTSVYLNPFTFSGGLIVGTTSGTANFAINYNSTRLLSTGIDVTYTDATKEILKQISGYIQYKEVKVSASINVSNIMAIFQQLETNPSAYATPEDLIDAINDEINAKITKDGALVATIELVLSSGQDPEFPVDIVLVFSDGTTEPAQPYFEEFAANIEGFLDYLDEYFN